MEPTQTDVVEVVTLSDDDIVVEATKTEPVLSAKHAAQLGKIGPERGDQNQQNYQNN